MSEPKICECGAKLVMLHGREWCANTLEKFRALHGEPKAPDNQT